ncbi:MAG: YggS family pyridoxal phosphate-dependent enzyme [Chloroflexi bacterium]|nr:YggS family pyridoxal phosphate-dependent enzyme [Chloroflexota bacterium]
MPAEPTTIAERYHAVLERIAQAAQRVGRNPNDIRLVVVTKAQPLERVHAVLEAGARDLGENYPEEAVTKIQTLRAAFPDTRWHMIGHLQRRKAPLVVAHFDMMHSVDRVRIAERLDRLCAQHGRVLPVLLEFNVGGEASKSGWPAWDEARWPELWPEIEQVLALPHLRVQGVMTIPPWRDNPEDVRPFFQRLRRLRDALARQFPHVSWEHLSMGMSHDFEVAIEEGATFVRVGTAIMGPRPSKGA